MKMLLYTLLIGLTFVQCKKIPVRSAVFVKAVSFDGTPLAEGQGIEMTYGTEADVVFEYSSVDPIEEVYIKLVDGKEKFETSDTENTKNLPKAGDTKGSFIYTIKSGSQFPPPTGLPLDDQKNLTVILLNNVGVVSEFTISVRVL